jgi:tetraacyldisaccharide 4'-kinase
MNMKLLERIWWDREPPLAVQALCAPLLLAEGLFAAGAVARGALYRFGALPSDRAPVPVISVGNLTVGGAGKTPVVLAIAERLQRAGRKVAVLSRGYGATRTDPRVVSDGKSVLLDPAQGGDEPVLIARRLPGSLVLCGPRRAPLARQAVELGAQVLLLDDGFQHRSLARDLDVVVVDASNPLGNGHLLPRGPQREPLSSLHRAGLVWFTKIDQHVPGDKELGRIAALAREATHRPVIQSRYGLSEVLDGRLDKTHGRESIAGKRVFLLAGLARPETFRQTVDDANALIFGERIFPDHHRFSDAELEEAMRAADRQRCDLVLTTEKDAVRLPGRWAEDPRVRALRIAVEIVSGEETLEAALAQAAPRVGG